MQQQTVLEVDLTEEALKGLGFWSDDLEKKGYDHFPGDNKVTYATRMDRAKADYRFCEDCNMVFDLWKYGSIEDAGHDGHNVRSLTKEEYIQALHDCHDSGCFSEA